MQIDVFTLFPEWFSWFFQQRHITNAMQAGNLYVRLFNYRDYTPLSHGQVDDTPCGGGAGMVLRVDVVCSALEAVYEIDCTAVKDQRPVLVLSPRGRRFCEPVVAEMVCMEEFTLLCGRYEGIDERISEHMATGELSIGDFVLSGGELPAMVVIDALARRLPGALGCDESAKNESFSPGMGGGTEHPHYTKPADYRGWRVPEVLLSGNHAEIEAWRRKHSGRG